MTTPQLTRGAFLTGALALTGLSACGGNSATADPQAEPSFGATTRMSVFGTTERKAKLDEAFALYTTKFGGSVDLQAIANEGYAEKLATEMAGGAAADVVALFQHITAQYAREELLVDLSEWGKVLDVSGLDQEAIAAGVIEERRNALPLGDNAYAAFYDTTRLDALGVSAPETGHTWDEFLAFAHDVTTASGGDYHGTVDAGGDMNFLEVYLRQHGLALYSEEGGLGFAEADLQQWFTIWDELRADGVAPPAGVTAESTTGGFGTSLIVTGRAANFFIFGNVFKGFSSLTENTLALTAPPVLSSSETGLYVRASNWMGAYARGKNVDDAVNMIDFLVNDPDAVAVLGAEFGAPPNLELRDALTYDPADQVFVDYVNLIADEYAQPIPDLGLAFPDGSDRFLDQLQATNESIAAGQVDPADGAAQFVEQMSGFLG